MNPQSPVACHYCQPEPVVLEEAMEGLPLAEGEFVEVVPGDPVPEAEAEAGRDREPESRSFDIDGKWLRFGCPNCQVPIRIRMREAAESIVDCKNCGLEVIPPDPDLNVPAQLTRASAAKVDENWMQKLRSGGTTKLPEARPRSSDADSGFEEEEDEDKKEEQEDREKDREDSGDEGPDFEEEEEKELRRPVKPIDDNQVSSAFREFDPTLIESPMKWESDAGEEEIAEKQGRPLRFATAGVVLFAALIAGGWYFWSHSGNEEAMAKLAAREKAANANRVRFLELARSIVGREDWRAMLPDVRQADRVQPLMSEYYRRNPYEPVDLVSAAEPANVQIGNTQLWQAVARDAGGQSRFVAFEKRGENWRLDWEAFVDLAHHDWERFKIERPVSPTVLRVVMARKSPLQQPLSDAGIPRENALGVRLWQNDRADSLVAIVEKDSFLGWQIEENLLWDAGALFIIEASWPAETELEDRVRIHRLLQRRWIYGVDESGIKVEGGTSTAARLP